MRTPWYPLRYTGSQFLPRRYKIRLETTWDEEKLTSAVGGQVIIDPNALETQLRSPTFGFCEYSVFIIRLIMSFTDRIRDRKGWHNLDNGEFGEQGRCLVHRVSTLLLKS
jgi:hypothetical protein